MSVDSTVPSTSNSASSLIDAAHNCVEKKRALRNQHAIDRPRIEGPGLTSDHIESCYQKLHEYIGIIYEEFIPHARSLKESEALKSFVRDLHSRDTEAETLLIKLFDYLDAAIRSKTIIDNRTLFPDSVTTISRSKERLLALRDRVVKLIKKIFNEGTSIETESRSPKYSDFTRGVFIPCLSRAFEHLKPEEKQISRDRIFGIIVKP